MSVGNAALLARAVIIHPTMQETRQGGIVDGGIRGEYMVSVYSGYTINLARMWSSEAAMGEGGSRSAPSMSLKRWVCSALGRIVRPNSTRIKGVAYMYPDCGTKRCSPLIVYKYR